VAPVRAGMAAPDASTVAFRAAKPCLLGEPNTARYYPVLIPRLGRAVKPLLPILPRCQTTHCRGSVRALP